MAKTVAGFISEKGGVGKTTACYHIAIALSRYYDEKVLVVDADSDDGTLELLLRMPEVTRVVSLEIVKDCDASKSALKFTSPLNETLIL